jgi:CSLREA domain-containing protein
MQRPVRRVAVTSLIAAIATAGLIVSATPASANTITVDSTQDDSPLAPAVPGCSLREAIHAANTNTMTGTCPAGSATEPDTIVLGSGLTYTLTLGDTPVEENGNQTGDLDVSDHLVIQGNGSTVDADGLVHAGCVPAPDRVFHILGVTTTINSLTIQGGGGIFDADCDGDGTGEIVPQGGGIKVESLGSLTLHASIVRRNSAQSGGGIANDNGQVELLDGTVVGDPNLGDELAEGNEATQDGGGIFTQASSVETVIVDDSSVVGNIAHGGGGGIFNAGDRVVIRNGSEVTDNVAGGTGDGEGGSGGGIATSAALEPGNPSSPGLFLDDSIVARNQANDCGECGGGHGGGIFNVDGHVEISGGEVDDNDARFEGGGIWTGRDPCGNGCTLILTESSITDNSSGSDGGGIYVGFDEVSIMRSTVSGNIAETGNGGGIWVAGQFEDIGAQLPELKLSVVNSTISNNSALGFGEGEFTEGGRGGGIYLAGGPMSLDTVTIATNDASFSGGNVGIGGIVAGQADLHNSILSLGFPENCQVDQGGSLNSLGYNLGEERAVVAVPDTCGLDQPTDLIDTSALLDELALNPPGQTATHRLLAGSPAIDSGPGGAACPTTDQRGVLRPQDGDGDGAAICDRGAFELEGQAEEPEEPTRPIPSPPPLPPPEECEILGTSRADILIGTAADEDLCGLQGDDTIRGGGGKDNLFGNEGDDRLNGGPGDDVLDGGAGSDTGDYSDAPGSVDASLKRGTAVGVGASTDTLFGLENLIGSAFDDILTGDGGPNQLRGKAGSDLILGGGGDDLIRGAVGPDTGKGGGGSDVVKGGKERDRLRGGGGRDTITGGQRNDDLKGNASGDAIRGGGGNDGLNGGAGPDSCNGGSGSNTLVNCEA